MSKTILASKVAWQMETFVEKGEEKGSETSGSFPFVGRIVECYYLSSRKWHLLFLYIRWNGKQSAPICGVVFNFSLLSFSIIPSFTSTFLFVPLLFIRLRFRFVICLSFLLAVYDIFFPLHKNVPNFGTVLFSSPSYSVLFLPAIWNRGAATAFAGSSSFVYKFSSSPSFAME